MEAGESEQEKEGRKQRPDHAGSREPSNAGNLWQPAEVRKASPQSLLAPEGLQPCDPGTKANETDL